MCRIYSSRSSSIDLVLILVLLVIVSQEAVDGFSFLPLDNTLHNGDLGYGHGRHVPQRLPQHSQLFAERLPKPQEQQQQQNQRQRKQEEEEEEEDNEIEESLDAKKLKKRRKDRKAEEYARRREEWLQRYGSLEALQKRFGSQSGDLTPTQTRRLYHTLLPRSLLGLYELGVMDPEELAPLAYRARIAAKEYARSRCWWGGRLFTKLVDINRNLRRGKLIDAGSANSASLTWDELYQKYEMQIVSEECTDELTTAGEDGCDCSASSVPNLTMRIYRRILEKSCQTNQGFDQLFLTNDNNGDDWYLKEIATQLETDIHEVLLPPKQSEEALKKKQQLQKQQEKEKEKIAKAERKQQEKQAKQQEKLLERQYEQQRKLIEQQAKEQQRLLKVRLKREEKQKKKDRAEISDDESTLEGDEDEESQGTPISPERYKVLRIMAGTRKYRKQEESSLNENADI